MRDTNIYNKIFYLKILQQKNCNINLPHNLNTGNESYVMLINNPISLSFTEFWNEDECTNKEAIITVAMMCGHKRTHQAKHLFRS